MDANAVLAEMLELSTDITNSEIKLTPEQLEVKAIRLANLVDDMNAWLFNGGTFPRDWMPF